MTRTMISELEWELILKLKSCRQSAGSAGKRFARILHRESKLSENGRDFLAFLLYRYRRQVKLSAEQLAWMESRKQCSARRYPSHEAVEDQRKLEEWNKLYAAS